MNDKSYKNKGDLVELYEKYNSMKDVADVCNCSVGTIKNWMDKFSINATDTHSNVRERSFTPVEHEPNTTCEFCESEFWRKPSLRNGKNFCDNECHGKWLSENIYGKNHHQYQRITVSCKNCGKNKTVPPSQNKKVDNHFCNGHCQTDYYDWKGEEHPSWKGGTQTYYGKSWYEMRDRVRQRDGNVCQKCGIGEDELGIKPAVHHYIPVREFDDVNQAHKMENMVQLCQSCHMDIEKREVSEQKEILQ